MLRTRGSVIGLWTGLLWIGLICAFMGSGQSVSWAQPSDQGYRLPPPEVVELVDAPPPPSVSLSPDGQWMLIVRRSAMPGIEDLARRMLRLAGMRIDPVANSRFSTSFIQSVALRPTEGGPEIAVPVPAQAKIADVDWSHRSDVFSLTLVDDGGSSLWVVATDAPDRPRMLVRDYHRVMFRSTWLPDGQSLICGVVPGDRGAEPADSGVPSGPNIQESEGVESPTRTYQDLLSNPHDEALLDYYGTAQLRWVSLDGQARDIGSPALFSSVSLSPDGQYLLVSLVKRPYSYLQPLGSFPHEIQVWNLQGQSVYQLADVPMAENIPIEGVRTGPRSVDWRSNEDATLVWVEALDGGDPRVEVSARDRLRALSAPFVGEPETWLEVEHRYSGLTEFDDPSLLVVSDYDRDRRWVRTLLHDRRRPDAPPVVLMDRSLRDRYGDPGSLIMRRLDNGQSVVRQDGDWVYRSGAGASPVGNLPFLDRQNLKTLESERLWHCEEGFYESVVRVLDSGHEALPTVITVRESTDLPPNYQLRDLASGQRVALTEFPDPTPQIRGIQKQLVKYQRADGVPLSATLYLPADYQAGTRLPLFVWAYPREFNDAATAGQVTDSPWRFTRIQGSSHLTLVTQGYAVMDSATMPVIGDPETMNDTFVEQIVAAAKAAIDHADSLGVADPERVGVGGHSYGAFMTANLLAHCDLFRAGVARSGAYNRTLTPFGFQSERRKFWDAKEIYLNLSPFMQADRIKQPILLIHGEVDNNSGTFPMQSQRLYQAIKGNGGTARLVMLPHESHGYQARESVLHTQYETIEWLDRYVKNANIGSNP